MSSATARKLFIIAALFIIITTLIGAGVNLLSRKETHFAVNTIPAGASMEFKDQIFKTPGQVKDVKEGSYTIVLKKEGYLERKERITITEKGDNDFTFRLYTEGTSPTAIGKDLEEIRRRS